MPHDIVFFQRKFPSANMILPQAKIRYWSIVVLVVLWMTVCNPTFLGMVYFALSLLCDVSTILGRLHQ